MISILPRVYLNVNFDQKGDDYNHATRATCFPCRLASSRSMANLEADLVPKGSFQEITESNLPRLKFCGYRLKCYFLNPEFGSICCSAVSRYDAKSVADVFRENVA